VSRTSNVNVTSERNPRKREPDDRAQPFLSVLLTALFGVPALVIVLRFFLFFSPELKWMMVWLSLFLFGTVGPGVALGIGHKVTKRIPFVIWHVALTIEAFAVAVSIGVILGWHRTGPHWWNRIADVFTVPASAAVIYLLCSIFFAGTWLLYRIDAFRAATSSGEEGGGLADLLKWPKGARIRANTIDGDEFAVTATIDHTGVPISQLRSALPALEENPGIIRGRSSIVPAERGGTSQIRLVHTDPHKTWRPWPGLSHPGESFAAPIRTAYYSDGAPQWFSFARTPDELRSRVAPKFRSPNDVFLGRQGMTGSGKSGDAAIEIAEVLSRTDVVAIYIDQAKIMQNAGWCLDMCTLASASRAQSLALFAALRRLGKYRADALSGYRNFNAAAAYTTGMPFIYIFADEFDIVKEGANFEWLATKGRSLGFRLSITLPRAVGTALSTDVRAAVGAWKQFGITQDYDSAFVISDETREAGANAEQFAASVPGAHYLDKAPGVDPTRYPIDCRTYETREDYGDLREAVLKARTTFTPATFTDEEISVLGPVWNLCRPSAVMFGAKGEDDAEPAVTTVTSANASEGTDMQQTMELDGDDLGEDLDPDAPAAPTAEERAEYGDPREPVEPLGDGQNIELDGPGLKPRPSSPEHAVAEFDAALVRMAERKVMRFTNADVVAEMVVQPSESWISKRFTGLCDEGKFVSPPGLTIERDGVRGHYLLTYIAGPRTHGA
jgi:hypothetical protein